MHKFDIQKIAAVITLYNPDEKIIIRAESLLPFVEKLFLIDNSDNSNDRIIEHFKNDLKVNYVFNGRNIGIAASMNIAIKLALEENFVFILTMDQDSEFESNSLEVLISTIQENEDVAIYSPFHKNKFFTKPSTNHNVEEVSDVMTSGNLLNLCAVKKVGFFREDYFIDYVDIEYCLRLRKNGYRILRVNSSILIHNEANLLEKNFIGKKIYPPNHKPFRWYYKVRNFFYLKKEYQQDFPDYFIIESRNIRNNIIKFLLYEREKYLKIKFAIKGYLDFRKNVKGKMS